MADRSHGFANFNFPYDCGTLPFKKFMAKKIIPVVAKNMVPTSTGCYFY